MRNRDVLNRPIQRGARIIDPEGNLYTVTLVSPAIVHLQDVKTGRRFNSGRQTLMLVPPADLQDGKMSTVKERKRYYYERAIGPRRRMLQ